MTGRRLQEGSCEPAAMKCRAGREAPSFGSGPRYRIAPATPYATHSRIPVTEVSAIAFDMAFV